MTSQTVQNAVLVGACPELVGSLSFGGLRAYCAGYAIDADNDDHLIYVALVGYRTAVRGVWAAILEHKAIEIAGQVFRRADGAYLHRAVSLPETGLEQMVMLHHQAAVPALEPNQPFYLISESERPPYARFWAMLNRAVAAPMRAEWAEWLWREAHKQDLISMLHATHGTFAWRVNAEDSVWLSLIQRGINQGRLKPSGSPNPA